MKVLVRLLALIILIAVVVKVSLVIADEKTKSLAWGTLKDNILSSVAWSPDGKTIAFVATPDMHGKSDQGEGDTPDKASIWLVDVGTQLGAPRLLYTVKVGDRGDGIPVGLFWLSKQKLGWETNGCRLCTIDIQSRKTSKIMKTQINLFQSRFHPEWNGPDDVNYDPDTQCLYFTGLCQPVGSDKASSNVVFIYKIKTDELEVKPLPIRIAARATISTPQWPGDYFVAGDKKGGMSLWHEKSDVPATQLATIDRGSILFPRTTPYGMRLLWIQNAWTKANAKWDKWELMLFDPYTKKRKIIAHLPPQVNPDAMPALGCPFAWSPKGDRVAFSDGNTIKLVATPLAKRERQ